MPAPHGAPHHYSIGRKGRKDEPPWLEPLCRIAVDFRQTNRSIYRLFDEANPDLSDRSGFVALVESRLRADATLVRAWQDYSADKRVDAGPWVDGTKVGYYIRGHDNRDKRTHRTPAAACADFIYCEARVVLSQPPTHRRSAR